MTMSNPEIAALAQRFITWARQSGCEPEVIRDPGKGIQRAWTIASVEVTRQQGYVPVSNCTSGRCTHASCMGSPGTTTRELSYLRIYTSGEVSWSKPGHSGPIPVNARHVERQIKDFVAKSGSRVPWPTS
jgi:hypothetical protein